MAIVCVGVDLAKNVFAIRGADDLGKAVWVQARMPRAPLPTHDQSTDYSSGSNGSPLMLRCSNRQRRNLRLA